MVWEIGITCQSDQAHLQCGNGSVSSQQSSIMSWRSCSVFGLGGFVTSSSDGMRFPIVSLSFMYLLLANFFGKEVFRHGMAFDQSYATESHDNLSKLSTLFLSFPSLAPHGARRAGQRLGAAMPGTGSLTGRSAKKKQKTLSIAIVCYCDLIWSITCSIPNIPMQRWKQHWAPKVSGVGSNVSYKCSRLKLQRATSHGKGRLSAWRPPALHLHHMNLHVSFLSSPDSSGFHRT